MKARSRFRYYGCRLFLPFIGHDDAVGSLFLLAAALIGAIHEQPQQRSKQDASAQEAAMAMVVMMTMAAVATKDHVPKSQDSKQTQHFLFLQFRRSVCTGHSVHV